MSDSNSGRVIYLSSFSYPTSHAHPLHALLMARAFAALFGDRFLFINGEMRDVELADVTHKSAYGPFARAIRVLGLRSLMYPLWLVCFLLFHPAWQENLTVFTNDLKLAGRLGLAHRIFGFRLIIDVHGAAGRATQRALAYADRIVFVTPGLRDALTAGKKSLLAKSIVRQNAVDAARFSGGDGALTRGKLDLSSDAFTLGYAGRFKPMESDKGVSFLIESLTRLTDVHLILVGGTPTEVADAHREANAREVASRVHVVPHVPVDTLAGYLAAADVLAYVPPARDEFLATETSPMKLFEYQAAGKPVIVSDLPALRATLVSDSSAELIEPGSMSDFVAAVERIRANRAVYESKAHAAALVARENTWEARARAALAHSTTPTKSMLRHAIEGIFVTATGDIVLKIFAALSTLLILHNLIPYDYGIWRLLLSALSALGLLGFTGVTGMFTADIARELGAGQQERARALLKSVTRFFTATGAVAAIALLVVAPIISRVSGIALTEYLDVLATTLLAAGFRQSYQIYFQAHLRPVASQVLKNSTTILYLIGIVLFITLLNLGVWGIVLAYTIANVVPVVFYLPSFLSYLEAGTTPREPYNFRRALFGRGRWAIAEDYVSALTSAAWPWITGYFLSIADVGLISLAMLLASQVSSVIPVQYVLRSLLPRMAGDVARVNEWLVRSMRYTLWAHIVVGLGVFCAIIVALPLVAPKYVQVIPLFGSLMPVLPFIAVGIVLTEWFYTNKRQKEFFIANAGPSIISMAFLPVLLIELGLTGYIAWYAINIILTDLSSLYFVRRGTSGALRLRSVPWPDTRDFEFLAEGIARARKRFAL
jgi:O-antigen/teichoic acid export membrane protein/glycosyltransferase involved in cell wall biosynthesis